MSEIVQVPDNSGNSMLPLAMMASGGMGMNGMNGWYGMMPWMIMPWMFAGGMGGGFGSWGGNGMFGALNGANAALNATTQAGVDSLGTQVQGLSNQIQDNANFGQLGTSVEGVKSQIGDINVGMVGGFANLAQDINGVQSAVQQTGCDVKSAILQQGADARLATCQQTNTLLMQNQGLQNAVQNGFTQLGFQLERNACDVKETSTANTQKIIDKLSNHWDSELQNRNTQLQDQITTLQQTQAIIAALGGTSAATAKATSAIG